MWTLLHETSPQWRERCEKKWNYHDAIEYQEIDPIHMLEYRCKRRTRQTTKHSSKIAVVVRSIYCLLVPQGRWFKGWRCSLGISRRSLGSEQCTITATRCTRNAMRQWKFQARFKKLLNVGTTNVSNCDLSNANHLHGAESSTMTWRHVLVYISWNQLNFTINYSK